MSKGGSSINRVTSVIIEGQKIARKVKKKVTRNRGTPTVFSHRKRVRHNAPGTLRLIIQ